MKSRILLLIGLTSFSIITIASDWLNFATPQRINEISIIEGKYYIASSGGLVIYDPIDGSKEHHFRTAGLPSSNIEDIVVDSDGQLWIGTYDNGIAFLQNDEWIAVPNPLSASSNTLLTYCLEFDANGALWVGTSNGIQKYENGFWTSESWSPVWDMTKLSNGDILAASFKPVIISNGVLETDTSCPIFAYSGSNVGETLNGEILFSASGFGVGMKTSSGWQIFDASNSVLTASALTDIETAADGTVWGVAPFGVYSYSGTFWKQEFTSNELDDLNYQTTQLLPTSTDVLIGTPNSITRYNGSSFSKIDLTHHQMISNFSELALNTAGEVVLKNGKSWFEWSDPESTVSKLNNPAGLDNMEGLMLFQSSSSGAGLFDRMNNEVWANGQQVSLFDSGTVDLATHHVRSFLADGNGTFWIGTLSGLYHTNGQSYILYDDSNSVLDDPSVWAIAEDHMGNIWVSTPDGIAKWDGNYWTYYDADDHNLMFAGAGFDFYFDDHNDLWFGGWGTGLVHFDGTSWEAYTTQNSNIADNTVFDIESVNGDLYIATDEGLSVFDGTDFINYTIDNSEILNNYCKQLVIDKDQNIWIMHSGAGISVFNKNGFTTSVDIIEKEIQSRIFPNPVHDQLTIEFEEAGVHLVDIFDLSGRKIKSVSTSSVVDVQSLLPGVYLLKFKNEVIKFSKF